MDITATYDQAASRWDSKLDRLGYYDAYLDFLAEVAGQRAHMCDIGTGTGAFAQAWWEVHAGREMTLVDPSETMLLKATGRMQFHGVPCINTYCETLENFIPKARFDTVLAAHMIEHCRDPQQGFHQLAALLRPDGKLVMVISKPHWCQWLIWLRYRHRWFDAEALVRLARNAGLSLKQTHDFKTGAPRRTSRGYVFTKIRKEK